MGSSSAVEEESPDCCSCPRLTGEFGMSMGFFLRCRRNRTLPRPPSTLSTVSAVGYPAQRLSARTGVFTCRPIGAKKDRPNSLNLSPLQGDNVNSRTASRKAQRTESVPKTSSPAPTGSHNCSPPHPRPSSTSHWQVLAIMRQCQFTDHPNTPSKASNNHHDSQKMGKLPVTRCGYDLRLWVICLRIRFLSEAARLQPRRKLGSY